MSEKVPKPLDEIVPEWAEQAYVPASNEFMAAALARIEEMHKQHPEVSNPTAVAISKEGKRVILANGRQIHESFCPRIALGSPSGTEYEFCPDHCASENHAEARAAQEAQEKGIDVTGGEAFLAGHYWACAPCWNALKRVGITKLNLVEDAAARYKNKRGALAPNQGKLSRPVTLAFMGTNREEMSRLFDALQKVGFNIIESPEAAEVLVDFSGKDNSADRFSGITVRADKEMDYRQVITDISRATEPLFGKAK